MKVLAVLAAGLVLYALAAVGAAAYLRAHARPRPTRDDATEARAREALRKAGW